MSETTYSLKVKTTGLTGREIEQLQVILESSQHVIAAKRRYRTLDSAPDGTFSIQASISTFHLILELKHPIVAAASAVATIGGGAYVKTVAEELAKETVKWLKDRLTNKSDAEVSVLIGTDGKLLEKVKYKR